MVVGVGLGFGIGVAFFGYGLASVFSIGHWRFAHAIGGNTMPYPNAVRTLSDTIPPPRTYLTRHDPSPQRSAYDILETQPLGAVTLHLPTAPLAPFSVP